MQGGEMLKTTQLEIRMTSDGRPPVPGESSIGVHRGGSAVLLGWLETQLGLASVETPRTDRIEQVAVALDEVRPPIIGRSLERDRWATARECLGRIEELRLEGWDGKDSEDLPRLVRELAHVWASFEHPFPDTTERLARVVEALENGQRLPDHRCALTEPMERWPRRWGDVLESLDVTFVEAPSPAGPPESALAAAQRHVLEGTSSPLLPDDSIRWVRSLSATTACEAVAAMLASEPEMLERTIICCENSTIAVMLDASLGRAGVPTCGASIETDAHPVSQVLPLVLRLCWQPVNPAVLLDFLSLPLCPVPGRARGKLAGALAAQPGLGSDAWEKAVAELVSRESDREGKMATRLAEWLDVERKEWGQPLPSALVRERCGKVAQWAVGRASMLDEEADAVLVEALHKAAGQASALGEIVETRGGKIPEPQLGRLLESTSGAGISLRPRGAKAGGPRIVGSLAEIESPCERLIWMGLSTSDAPSCRWTSSELEQLRDAGVALDDGTRQLEARRKAERHGLAIVESSLLAISLPSDEGERPHPVWVQILGSQDGPNAAKPVQLDEALAGGADHAMRPWVFPSSTRDVVPPQPQRALWTVAPGLLRERDTCSASSLETRLACPLKWVFTYNASLRSSPIARLPDSFRLMGSFCHQVLERVFGSGGALPETRDAVDEVGRCFDDRIALDAAPLAQPSAIAERMALRAELVGATEIFVEALRAGGYVVRALEQKIEGKVDGRELRGYIDCLAETPDGEEAVIDFKYGGRKKYPALLEEGRAVQLATYARVRKNEEGELPAVAYLVLKDGLLCTPEGSPLRGAEVQDGPSIGEVWDRFESALRAAESWMSGSEPIPARPLQPPDEWPPGVEIVVEEEDPRACTYCDYAVLCGRKRVE